MSITAGSWRKGTQVAKTASASRSKQKWPISVSVLSIVVASFALWAGVVYVVQALPWFD